MLETTEWGASGDWDEKDGCEPRRQCKPPVAKFHDCSVKGTLRLPFVQDYLATRHWKLNLQQQKDEEGEEEKEEEKEENKKEDEKEEEQEENEEEVQQQQQQQQLSNSPTGHVVINLFKGDSDETIFEAKADEKLYTPNLHSLPPMQSDTHVIYVVDVRITLKINIFTLVCAHPTCTVYIMSTGGSIIILKLVQGVESKTETHTTESQ